MIGLIVYMLLVYLGIGALIALPLSLWWIRNIDPVTNQSTLGFRFIVIPGLILLWPIMLLKAKRA